MNTRTAALGFLGLLVLLAGCGRQQIDDPQYIRDQNLAISLVLAISDLAEQNIDGQPVGPLEKDAACPDGGTVYIRGTLGQTAQEMSYDSTYELRACAFSADYGSFWINVDATGDLSVAGSWDRATGYGSEHMTSSQLRLSGRSTNGGYVNDFDDACPFGFHLLTTQLSDAYYGDWCERPFASSMSHRG